MQLSLSWQKLYYEDKSSIDLLLRKRTNQGTKTRKSPTHWIFPQSSIRSIWKKMGRIYCGTAVHLPGAGYRVSWLSCEHCAYNNCCPGASGRTAKRKPADGSKSRIHDLKIHSTLFTHIHHATSQSSRSFTNKNGIKTWSIQMCKPDTGPSP